MNWFGSGCVVAAVVATLVATARGASDGIFPAEGDAKKAIHWTDDNAYFVIKDRPTFIASGEIHYARVPRELWRERILRAKAMGLNTIQTYVMWNAHEGKEGVFDFSGILDLDAWLTTVQECGMYTVVRPGPYVCAEWEGGGIPAWLSDKPGIKIRTDDEQYLKYVDRFETKVFDILAKHQIHKGSTLLMVQLENELGNTWGTDGNAYTKHLYELARARGLEIPLFNSGLHHGNDPAGEKPFGKRNNPWYSTEFWTGWIGLTGEESPQMAELKVRGTWKIIGFGGGGYDYYVVHGGTNFGYSKGSEVTASYDYASPIGEAGQLRQVYWPLKRAAMFATSFDDVLTASKDDPKFVASATGGVTTFTRTSANGTVVFVADAARFQGKGAATAPEAVRTKITVAVGQEIPAGKDKTMRLEPGEIRPVLVDVRLTKGVVLVDTDANILLKKKIGGRLYVVLYGQAGESCVIRTEEGELGIHDLKTTLMAFGADDTIFEKVVGDVTFLAMNTGLADRTWVVGESLVIGPHYASADGVMEAGTKNQKVVVISASGRKEIDTPLHDDLMPLPKLDRWQVREGATEAMASTDVSKWPASKEPRPMEQYDDYANGWGWYQTTIHRDTAGEAAVRFSKAGDVVRVFLNGQRVTEDRGGAKLDLKAGDNTLAVLCWNDGRPKMPGFSGATGLMAAKGIWGPVMIADKPLATIGRWRMMNAGTAGDNAPAAAEFDDAAWKEVAAGADTMGSRLGYAWFRATFELPEKTTQAVLMHQGIDDEGEIFLNGQSVGKHVGWNVGGSVDLSKGVKAGKNVLAVRVKNNDGAGGIAAAMDIVAVKGNVENWEFHAGLDGLDETPLIGTVTNWEAFMKGGWQSDPSRTRAAGLPSFYRAEFTYARDASLHQPICLRTTGLKAGSAWINGHNLGTYKNGAGKAVEMYVPECWIADGKNALVVFDAEGADPTKATLEAMETWVEMKLK